MLTTQAFAAASYERANPRLSRRSDVAAFPQPSDKFGVAGREPPKIRLAHVVLRDEAFNLCQEGDFVNHAAIVSAIADRSSSLYQGRADAADARHFRSMDEGWRQRIEAAAARDGRSPRDISLSAGLSHGYLHGILRDGKEPTLDRFVKICAVLNISVAHAMLGVDLSRETEEIIRQLEADPGRRAAMLSLLRRTPGS